MAEHGSSVWAAVMRPVTFFMASAGLAAFLWVAAAQAAVIEGTSRDDQLRGTQGADTIHARKGDDRVWARRGADRIWGGRGWDDVNAGRGPDYLYMLDGRRDSVFCGDGVDEVVADRRDWLNDCERVSYGGLVP